MISKSIRTLFALLLLVVGAVQAEEKARTWTDKKGNTITATFVRMSGLKAVLEIKKGKQVIVPASGLSESDQEYLKKNALPEMEIHIDKDQDVERLADVAGYTQKEESVALNISIRKKSRAPSTKKFTAVVYVIGETVGELYDVNQRKVLAYKEHSFSFAPKIIEGKEEEKDAEAGVDEKKKESADETTFTVSCSNIIDDRLLEKKGWQYDGYVLLVKDESNTLITFECSTDTFSKWIPLISNYKDGEKMLPSRSKIYIEVD